MRAGLLQVAATGVEQAVEVEHFPLMRSRCEELLTQLCGLCGIASHKRAQNEQPGLEVIWMAVEREIKGCDRLLRTPELKQHFGKLLIQGERVGRVIHAVAEDECSLIQSIGARVGKPEIEAL